MAGVLITDKVLYKCSCGANRPIPKIYFCRHCMKIRCGDCVFHEVDSHYCPNCLEYMPTPEAKLKKNRCANCFDCPSCMHTLSIRATNVQNPSTEDPTKTVPKKVYYLVCGFCRWTSRDVGIPDQNAATGCWPEQENEHVKRISQLLEYYRGLAQEEKLERERRKFSQRYSIIKGFTDNFSISATVARKIAGLSPGSKDEDTKIEDYSPSQAVEEMEAFPEEFLTEPINLAKICTIKQRLMQPDFQPTQTSQLYPRHKSLLIKRSQRCKVCEHNLSKPEYNPSSIKFKIQLTAFYHIVELRIKSIELLKFNKSSRLELTLCNPTAHVAHVSFSLLDSEDMSNGIVTAKLDLPKNEFSVPARDDTAEFDDVPESQQYLQDEPAAISFQKGNKIGFFATVTPKLETGDVQIGLKMKHDFINVVVQLQGDQREPQIIWLEHTIWLNLGKLNAPQI